MSWDTNYAAPSLRRSIWSTLATWATAGYACSSTPSGTFRRALRMPAPINADKVEAKITDGVLTLRLPKAESARPKKIKVAVK